SDVLTVQEQAKIPELNEYQCGTFSMHSLEEAHEIARNVLARGIGVNHNDELALPEEKLKSLQVVHGKNEKGQSLTGLCVVWRIQDGKGMTRLRPSSFAL